MPAENMPPLDDMVALAARMRGSDLRAFTVTEIRDMIKALMGADPMYVLGQTHKRSWFRGRICDTAEGFGSLREMIYPPTSRDFGRANIVSGQ
jgi:hypothetical protein